MTLNMNKNKLINYLQEMIFSIYDVEITDIKELITMIKYGVFDETDVKKCYCSNDLPVCSPCFETYIKVKRLYNNE